jgi:hypothetical protein
VSLPYESAIYRTVEKSEQQVNCRMTENNNSDGGGRCEGKEKLLLFN